MNSLPYRLETTKDILTSRAGLACISELMNRIGLSVNDAFPKPGSNRGFNPSCYVNIFVMLLNEGGSCLEDVRHLKAESSLMSLSGVKN